MNKKTKGRSKVYFKIRFYIMSLTLLFFLIFLLNFRVDILIDFKVNLLCNILTVISLVFVFAGYFCYLTVDYEWKGSKNPSYKVNKVKSENFEYLTFLTTYIIPLICFNMDKTRYVIVLGVLLLVIGIIFVKMDLYYGNPTLALMGYRLYTIYPDSNKYPDGIMVITKDRIKQDSDIRWIEIDENFWFVKEIVK